MTVHMDNRQATIRYLMQMADEMKKMAQNAFAPSLALLFDMASDEARNYLENAAAADAAGAGRAKSAGNAKRAAGKTAAGIAGIVRSNVRNQAVSVRQGRNHAAIMADKAPRKLKLHQAEIKA